jgi:4-amino-4-deoxy-L-arabinose transferase-like glycosyltransferase
MGVVTIPPLYLLARETYGNKVAIVSSIVMATSPYFIVFSRLGYNNIQALFFTTLTLYWLYIGVQRNSFFYIFLAGGMAGLDLYVLRAG